MPTANTSSRKRTYLWVSIIVVIFGVLTLPSLLTRIKERQVVDKDRMTMTQEVMYPGEVEDLVFLPSIEGNRRMPEFEFTDQHGEVFHSSSLEGKVVVLDFFFTTCPTICPLMSQNMAYLSKAFENEEVALVSISINPRYDTPERLKAYQEKYAPESQNWWLLNGDAKAVYELAEKGFYLIAQEDGEAPGGFEHSGMFALIDQDGFFRSSKDSFGNPLIYYRGTVTPEMQTNEEGEEEQISQLAKDIKNLLHP